MASRNTKMIIVKMKLTDEAVCVFFANDGQGIITIDDFAQLNEKYVEGIFRVLRRPGGTTGGCPILGLQCQKWMKRTYKERSIILSI